jgi:thioester reductase-like protein
MCGLLKDKNVRIPLSALYSYTLGHIDDALAAASSGGIMAVTLSVLDATVVDWAEEWTLPADILTSSCSFSAQASSSAAADVVFVTGATGFVGPVLVVELLRRFPAPTRIVCLVRGPDGEACTERVVQGIHAAQLELTEDDKSRLSASPGSLDAPRFGLDEAAYSSLVAHCVAIVHNGAFVNHALPYSVLKKVNVCGTVSVIRLALAAANYRRSNGGKSFTGVHYVSSVSALPTGQASAEEFQTLSSADMSRRDGYGQSKAVAERLLLCAHESNGMPLCVYRPSVICGDSRTGYSNISDYENHLIRAVVLAGAAVTDTSFSLGWISVDAVAKAVASIAALKLAEAAEAAGLSPPLPPPPPACCFHLNGTGPLLRNVVRLLSSPECGSHNIRSIPPSAWRSTVMALDPQDTVLEPYREMIADISWPDSNLVNVSHSHGKADAALQVAGEAGLIAPVDDDTIVKFIKFLQKKTGTPAFLPQNSAP